MSQASRRHALRHETERRQVALEVAKLELTADIVCANCTGMGIDFDVNCTADGCATRALGGSGFTAHDAGPNCEATCTLCEGEGTGRAALALALLTDHRQGFDVHAARAHATGLVLYGRHHARVSRRLELDSRGLPRWATPVGDWAHDNPGAPWPHLGGVDLAFVRLGQRILDALEGQPSECAAGCWINGVGVFMKTGAGAGPSFYPHECPDCHGSGHNLRGVLPPVEWSPAVRRRVSDHHEGTALESNLHHRQWLDDLGLDIFQRLRHPGPDGAGYHTTDTRVCPRGEHRQLSLEGQELDAHGSAAWYGHRPASHYAASPEDQAERVAAWEHATSRLPAWRRGEIEHARQRREREARRGELGQADNGAWLVRARWAAAQYIEANKVEVNAAGCEAIEAVIMAELGDAVAGARVFITDHEAGRMDITLIAHSEMAPLDLRGTFTL